MGRKTPLYDWHVSMGARIVDFGGWDMPVVYRSIIEEHNDARTKAGLFDISHMGRLEIEGPQATAFLERVLTNRVDNLRVGQVRYSLVLNEAAGTLDDVLVYRPGESSEKYFLVVNASNREKIVDWLNVHLGSFNAKFVDRTLETGMIACQGPLALELAQRLVSTNLSATKYYYCTPTEYRGALSLVSRTGYTGEDGVEFVVPADKALELWNELREGGAEPVGLGARDTLRLEAGMPLYGHELSESIDPIQAGLSWAVKKDIDFIGKTALATRDPQRPVRVGLRLDDKRIAREGFTVNAGGSKIGWVSSGTFAPTVQASIAMAYVEPNFSSPGTKVDVIIRDRPASACVVPLPFYSRSK